MLPDTTRLTSTGLGKRVVLEGITEVNDRGSKAEEANEDITAHNGSVGT